MEFGRSVASYEGFDFAACIGVDDIDGSSERITGRNFNSKLNPDAIPLTANIMVERNLIGGLGMYVGGGIGYAWTNVDITPDLNIDDSGGFYGQISMG